MLTWRKPEQEELSPTPEYTSFLLSAATAHDDQYKPKREKRQVFSHEFIDDVDGTLPDEDPYDIDAPVTVIQANVHDQRHKSRAKSIQPRVHMPCDHWFSLSDKDHQLWDQLDDKAKATILGNSDCSSINSIHDQCPSDKPTRRMNLHDMSAYEFLQVHFHDLNPDSGTVADGDTDFLDSPSKDIMILMVTQPDTHLINSAKSQSRSPANTLTPGDIHHVMSQSSKHQQSINVMQVV